MKKICFVTILDRLIDVKIKLANDFVILEHSKYIYRTYTPAPYPFIRRSVIFLNYLKFSCWSYSSSAVRFRTEQSCFILFDPLGFGGSKDATNREEGGGFEEYLSE